MPAQLRAFFIRLKTAGERFQEGQKRALSPAVKE